jgi:hypothetical protein
MQRIPFVLTVHGADVRTQRKIRDAPASRRDEGRRGVAREHRHRRAWGWPLMISTWFHGRRFEQSERSRGSHRRAGLTAVRRKTGGKKGVDVLIGAPLRSSVTALAGDGPLREQLEDHATLRSLIG